MMFGIFLGFLTVMVGLLLAAAITGIIMIVLGKSAFKSLTRFNDSLKRLFTKTPKVHEVHTVYEENGIKKERIEVMK